MSLHELLCGSARRWATTALDAYMEDPPDLDFAVHHMAVAVEHLSKAYLCSVSDMLLVVDGRPHINDLLILAGHGGRTKRQLSDVKTVGGESLSSRVETILGRPPAGSSIGLQRLREARNGITHLGLGQGSSEVQPLLADGIAYLNDLLTELKRSTATFWGRHDPLTAQLVKRTIADRQLRYNAKLQAALARFRRQYGTLPDTQGAGAHVTLSPVPHLFGFSMETDCPACGNLGIPVGGIQYSRRADGPSLRVWFDPRRFSCSVCSLALEGDELELAGITGCFLDLEEEDLDWWLSQQLPEWDVDRDL
jgi:hypothetical protein